MGYLPRAAFLMDRILSKGGLSGKSFIPLISCFACAIPGIMATRVIESRRDRMITILVAPLMSCSARLVVYTLFIGAFIPSVTFAGGFLNLQGAVLLMMYCIGAVIALAVSMILRRTAFKSESREFGLFELPPYKWPSLRNVWVRMYIQGRAFLTRAGTFIFCVTVVVWALTYFPRPASVAESFDARRAEVMSAHNLSFEALEIPESVSAELARIDVEENMVYIQQSVLGRIGRFIEPVVAPLGWDWRIGTAALASFPAREVVIAVLGVLYGVGGDDEADSRSLIERMRMAKRPDGRPVFTIPVALSIMIFFALCAQCGATLATIGRETNSWRWPVFVFGYMTTLAYIAAFLTYQIASLFLTI